MLKWLRKYNTWILVIGGTLLMVAFLLPQTIQELGKRGPGSSPMSFAGHGRVSGDEYGVAIQEFTAIREIVARGGGIDLMDGRYGESVDHYFMLTHEASQAGLIGGVDDGKDMVEQIIRDIARMLVRFMRLSEEQAQANAKSQMDNMIPRVLGETRLTMDQFYQAMAKLKGILRLRSTYDAAPRFSDRRVIVGARKLNDAAMIDYIVVPADREIAGVPAPGDAAMLAHFEKFKGVKSGEGEYGIGYTLPARIKLTWMNVNRELIRRNLSLDAVEVQKRFLTKYPGGTVGPGEDLKTIREGIEKAVLDEAADKVLKTADQAVRGELEKPLRRLESDGDYKRLPADWASLKPDFNRIAGVVVARIAELHGVSVPKPTVTVQDKWTTLGEMATLPSIPLASLNRGNRRESFSDLAFKVREIAGNNPSAIQVGVPSVEPVIDSGGNHYFFVIDDARKESPVDSVDEVRDRIGQDIMRIAAFEKLKAKVDSIKATAIAPDGINKLAAAPDASSAQTLTIINAKVDSSGFSPPNAGVDTESVRELIHAAAQAIDPTKDPATVDPAARTVVVPVSRALGVLVARITSVSPVTTESLRGLEGMVMRQLSREEISRDTDPFSLKALEKRLRVKYPDERKKDKDEKAAKGAKPAA